MKMMNNKKVIIKAKFFKMLRNVWKININTTGPGFIGPTGGASPKRVVAAYNSKYGTQSTNK